MCPEMLFKRVSNLLHLLAQRPLTRFRTHLLARPSKGSSERVYEMAGQISVPDDFDRMGSEEIERIFDGGA
jgi:hypothetical protein